MKRVVLAAAAIAVIAGCASDRWDGSDLVPGQATVEDVEKTMGKAADRRAGPNGSTVLWFPRLPAGRVSYAATIGKDGKLVSIEQRLTREHLQTLKVGASREDDVRDLLGPPERIDPFPRRQRTAWSWHAQEIEPALIVVEFSADGIVRSASMFDDPDARSRGGGSF